MATTGIVDIAEKVKKIIAERLDKPINRIADSSRFREELGADSLDITELLMALEEEFNIEIDDEANNIETAGQAIQYIQGKIAGKAE